MTQELDLYSFYETLSRETGLRGEIGQALKRWSGHADGQDIGRGGETLELVRKLDSIAEKIRTGDLIEVKK